MATCGIDHGTKRRWWIDGRGVGGRCLGDDSFVAGELYLDGVQNVLSEQEFTDSAKARKALQLLEKRTFLEDFLASALSP